MVVNMLLVIISSTEQYLLENSLSIRLTTKVSLCRSVLLCEGIVHYNYYLAKEYHKEMFKKNVTCFFIAFFFPIQTVAGSGYYGTDPLYRIRLLFLSCLSVTS